MNSDSVTTALVVSMMLLGAACVFVFMHVQHSQTTTFADRIIAAAEQDRQQRREQFVRDVSACVAGARLATQR